MSNMKNLLVLLILPALFSPVPAESSNPSSSEDILGLIIFKADLQDPYQKLASWNEDDETPCNWIGVKCNPRTNRVTELNLHGFFLLGRIGLGVLQLQFLRKLSLSNNNFTGNLNPNLLSLQNIEFVDLSNNGLSGFVPKGFFGQCGSLSAISLAINGFSGKIPESISSCSSLVTLNFSSNRFSGSLPHGFWSLSALKSLDLSGNSVEGEIPNGIGSLNNLHALNLSKNRLTGSIPYDIGSCLMLKSIDLSDNSLSGNLPESMQKLRLCNHLNIHKNVLDDELPKWIGEMKSLQTLDLSMNKFSGSVPESIGKLLSLKVLNFSGNGFTGSLPKSILYCRNLRALDFSRNSMTDDLPGWIFQSGLEQVSVLKSRKPNGKLKSTSVQKLQVLDLSHNSFSGEIGAGIGILIDLKVLNLSMNCLVGRIPGTIGDLKHLEVLDLSHNQLNGSIPRETGGAVSLKELRLEDNLLEGKIPSSLENCSSVQSLILSQNKLEGTIPEEIAKLTKLQDINLSFNHLNENLPQQLANLANLHSFNISHNHLQGELPTGGFFNTISPDSVSDNPSLCGTIVKKSCPTVLPKPIVFNPNSTSGSSSGVTHNPNLNHKRIILTISSLIAISAATVIVIGVIAITVVNLHVRVASASKPIDPFVLSSGENFSCSATTDSNSGKLVIFSGQPDEFSTGTHALLNKDCELGRSGFGAVYKTVLKDGRQVAIKKLTVSSLVKSQEEFESEVKKLKIRHPNLVSLLGYYWTPSLQLLIYEFVPGGSLYEHLHEAPERNFLSWTKRFDIILATAKSLAYLHQLNIIHYNIKSANILFDNSGEPKVGDYGLANLLPMLDRYVLSTKIQSASGYMGPEFSCKTVKITEKCDVYGFGVLVLEVVTGKKPVEYLEDDVIVLCDTVRGAVEEGRIEGCVDSSLQGRFPAEEAISVMKLGLICTSQVPSNRPDMKEAVNILEMSRCRSNSLVEVGWT